MRSNEAMIPAATGSCPDLKALLKQELLLSSG